MASYAPTMLTQSTSIQLQVSEQMMREVASEAKHSEPFCATPRDAFLEHIPSSTLEILHTEMLDDAFWQQLANRYQT